MDWIRENTTSAAIIGVSAVAAIGLGVVLFSSYSGYEASTQQFSTLNQNIAALKSGPLAPTQENLAAKHQLVSDYMTQANSLATVMLQLQKLDSPVGNTEFQSQLKAKIAAIRQFASERRLQLPAEFNLGFDKYTTELPKNNEVAARLAGCLESIDQLVRMFINCGVLRLDLLERDELPAEKDGASAPDASASPKAAPKAAAKGPKAGKAGSRGTPPPPPAKVTESWQMRTVIVCDQAALQQVLSKLASPSETQEFPYFPIVRLLRIENERKEGPPTVVQAALGPDGVPIPPVGAAPTPTPSSGSTPPNPDAIQSVAPAPPDSSIVLGNEKLRVFLEIDMVRFLPPPATASR